MASLAESSTLSSSSIPPCSSTAVHLPARSPSQSHHVLQGSQDIRSHLLFRPIPQAVRESTHPLPAGGGTTGAGGISEQPALQDRHQTGRLPLELLHHHFVLLQPRKYPSLHSDDEELLEKQKTLFELNKLINKKLEINQQYYQDIKFLFIGDEEIYKIIQVGNTLVEFYPKER